MEPESPERAATPIADLPSGAGVRLVVCDMDGTLLDEHGEIPSGLWPQLEKLRARDVLFAPASGRQYENLAARFGAAGERMVFIAENGTHVVRGGRTLSTDPIDRDVVVRVVETVRALAAGGADVGFVVCGRSAANVERNDARFVREVERYYASLRVVGDATAVEDELLKVAVFDFGGVARSTAPALDRFRATHQVVVSGAHWVDVMAAGANKGRALRALQRELGITRAETLVFGDYLNDREMLEAADLSFAMANAHPEILRVARYVAPSHREHGVLRTLERLMLGLS